MKREKAVVYTPKRWLFEMKCVCVLCTSQSKNHHSIPFGLGIHRDIEKMRMRWSAYFGEEAKKGL